MAAVNLSTLLVCCTLLMLLGFPDVFALPEFRVVDLTHDLSDETIYWPGNPAYNFSILARGQMAAGFWYESNYVGQAEHGGTHVDAPGHFYDGGWRTHQIPMERLTGPAVIVDVKEKARADPDYRVQIQDLTEWESVNGRIPDKAAVIMNSGWGDKYPNKTAVFSSATPGNPSTFHFPGWHENTARWLITNRNVYIIGVDTPSTDYGQSTAFPTHVHMGKNSVIGLENVANLDRLPGSGSHLFAGVIKTKSGSGGPARIFATIFSTEEECTNSATTVLTSALLPFIVAIVGSCLY